MKIVLIVIAYLICLFFELFTFKNMVRRKRIFYIILMCIALIESIIISITKEGLSFATLIEYLLAPISKKIYGS